MQKIVQIKDLIHKFVDTDAEGNVTGEKNAVDSVSLDVEKGEFIAILGHNGSGKSTLAKHINAILMPTSGILYVNGKDTADARNIWDIRQSAGMVFQNPDNQIVTDYVWHELAFGLENMALPVQDIRRRVSEMASFFGMEEWFHKKTCQLSGGQKQMLNLASVMVMQPEVLILDEPNSYVDKRFESHFYKLLDEINKESAVILVSHDIGTVLAMVKNIACVNETLHYHPGADVSEEWLGEKYACPIELIGHGDLPHRVLKKHEHE